MRNKLYPTLASYYADPCHARLHPAQCGSQARTISSPPSPRKHLRLSTAASETPDPLGTYFPTATLGTAVNTPLVVSTATPG